MAGWSDRLFVFARQSPRFAPTLTTAGRPESSTSCYIPKSYSTKGRILRIVFILPDSASCTMLVLDHVLPQNAVSGNVHAHLRPR